MIPDALPLILSVLSLLVAGLAAYFTYNLSRFQIRLATRHEFQKLLLEMNKELIRDPELWGVYKSHPMAGVKTDDPVHRTKLEGFVYMMLNIFQIVHAYMEDGGTLSAAEQSVFKAWKGTCEDFVNNSDIAWEILSRKDSELVYNAGFLAFIRGLREGGHVRT